MMSNDVNDVTAGVRLKGTEGGGSTTTGPSDIGRRTHAAQKRANTATRRHRLTTERRRLLDWRRAIARATRRTREIAAGQSELVPRDPTSPRAGP